ncbi:membrane protein insertion efficiency factor YidD [Massilia sp. ST3]|uniref:membrane protein insertion efficiency factor YidD n=1 Tax=Massilia sp. ST3 TaxID=2824903 RepID=UPI001B823E43|nr:membrane protein insertion efficiency factor YidD [Massilia sp. ST3]MBQ5946532.1 membrane protein insertion efficiency factor YidD [Massilia sp. ST3]
MRGASSLAARLALWAIRLYQRHLSPLKGFSCAYRVHRGGAGCSAYGYRAIARHGLFTGLALLDRRLQRCGAAYRAPRARNPVLHHQRGDCDCLSCDLPGNDCDFSPCDGLSCDWPDRRQRGGACRRWRERRWLAKAAKQQRERAERERRERFERERQERDRQP